ncbi:hypothetical protein EAE99_003058 [Botrytis elliptica]|nr:hypothetical protein EAE99_003058 [Botrytis elliptica]
MVQFGITLLPLLMAVATVNGYSWMRCTNAPQCRLSSYGGSTTGGGNNPAKGGRFSYAGGYIFAYDTCSGFAYSSDGYWYSHDKDGLFVSPTGYKVEEETAAFPTVLVKILKMLRPITLVSVEIVTITNIWGL